MIIPTQAFKFFALAALFFSIGLAAACAETTGQFVDDTTITAKVKSAILSDSQLSVLQVKVDTLHGTVTLSGNVDTKAQDDEAVKDAKMVDGVAHVTDNLTIANQ
ncbi:MAG: BON domain-containing protein [Alphaproteobacteria bacterium]